ncbi:MAG: chromosomal replication initiator protein DnaA, partial [Clostridia bacterium]|nr:chromosomal replication initiator protein DnaA [Clostridia bacterium]
VGENKVLNRASVPTAFAEYTFENFVVGKSNQFAQAAALSVATHPAGQANPLFIYGNSGLGKTHLLYAITHRIKQNFPDYKVVYVKGEEFTNQMIDAISRNLNAEFREKYRSADVLLIDDIQFIAGREATQEEFFHTFNQLYENVKQLILASDLPPRDITRLEERLRTRFECGVIADINPPDLELRTAIVKKKAQNLGVSLPDEVMEYIAENLNNNIRQLEGAVKRICAQCMLTGTPVSLDLAVRSISDQVVGSESVTVTIDNILAAVSSHYGLTVEDLKSRKRTSNIASARHVAIYMIKKLTDRSLPAIGRVFGRDHTTIINSIDAVEKKLASDSSFDSEVHELLRTVKKR